MAVSPKKVAWEISTFQVVNKGTHKEPLFLFYNPWRSQLRTICDISLLVAPEWFVPFGWEMDEDFWIALSKCIPTKMLFSWKLLPWKTHMSPEKISSWKFEGHEILSFWVLGPPFLWRPFCCFCFGGVFFDIRSWTPQIVSPPQKKPT